MSEQPGPSATSGSARGGNLPSPAQVAQAVATWDGRCRRAFDAGSAVREFYLFAGDEYSAAVLDLELDALVKNRWSIARAQWLERGEDRPRMSVLVMMGKGWGNDQDPQCADFVQALVEAQDFLRGGLGLGWSWADGLPPGWFAAVAPFDEAWPQPWNPPIPGPAR